jgi:hypothetical protein
LISVFVTGFDIATFATIGVLGLAGFGDDKRLVQILFRESSNKRTASMFPIGSPKSQHFDRSRGRLAMKATAVSRCLRLAAPAANRCTLLRRSTVHGALRGFERFDRRL